MAGRSLAWADLAPALALPLVRPAFSRYIFDSPVALSIGQQAQSPTRERCDPARARELPGTSPYSCGLLWSGCRPANKSWYPDTRCDSAGRWLGLDPNKRETNLGVTLGAELRS